MPLLLRSANTRPREAIELAILAPSKTKSCKKWRWPRWLTPMAHVLSIVSSGDNVGKSSCSQCSSAVSCSQLFARRQTRWQGWRCSLHFAGGASGVEHVAFADDFMFHECCWGELGSWSGTHFCLLLVRKVRKLDIIPRTAPLGKLEFRLDWYRGGYMSKVSARLLSSNEWGG